MAFVAKKILSLHVDTPNGLLILSPKTGEDPEIKPFTSMIDDADDGMTNDGRLILNSVQSRSYIQNVYAYQDSDIDLLISVLNAGKQGIETPVNAVMMDGSIYSNVGIFVGDIIYNGTGTIELKFASAKDWVLSN